MAQNDLKPDHSSSEEEEDDEETSGSDSGEKPKQEPKKALIPPQSATKRQAPDLPSSESEESDSDSPPKTSAIVDSTFKPNSSVSIQLKSVKRDGSKSILTPPPAKSKRPPPAPAAEKDAKKAKQNTANGERNKSVAVPDPSSSEEELSDSGTDSDSVPPVKRSAVADPNIKPISSKPMEREVQTLGSTSAKKPGSKSVSTPSPAKSKQPLPAPDLKNGKKNTGTDDDSKKQLFQRLWSEDDEIVVLQGMIDFKTERNGKNPVADSEEFHDFIRKSLHVDVSRTQLVDKIRRLKKKYVNNASKEKKDGKDRYFAKSHEQKAYELSKLIWCSNNNSNININSNTRRTEVKKNQSQKNGNSKATGTGTGTVNAANVVKSNGVDNKDELKMEVEVGKKMDISRFVQYGVRSDSSILSEEIVKAGMELVEGSKGAELEAKWKNLMEQELELYVKRMELLKEQALVVLEAVKSSGN